VYLPFLDGESPTAGVRARVRHASRIGDLREQHSQPPPAERLSRYLSGHWPKRSRSRHYEGSAYVPRVMRFAGLMVLVLMLATVACGSRTSPSRTRLTVASAPRPVTSGQLLTRLKSRGLLAKEALSVPGLYLISTPGARGVVAAVFRFGSVNLARRYARGHRIVPASNPTGQRASVEQIRNLVALVPLYGSVRLRIRVHEALEWFA
jgi:hypothetical protein